ARRNRRDRDLALVTVRSELDCDGVSRLHVVRRFHFRADEAHPSGAHYFGGGAARLEKTCAPEPAVDSKATRAAVLVVAHRISACRRSNKRRRRAGRSSVLGTRAATSPIRANATRCPANPAWS